ncbi:MAG: gamma-glutamyl-gamma-aminobutyrate hydrolase family protein [Actinobacteria bacterium]|nr:gamma-glutamyl-gamma-aminobutyrate hydrolase family protein [Actinomycetota bacterium]MBU4509487.1 gamma-glutamyl-gamma-aminobutyrate hydrolase family protein [bacterium]
MDPVIGISCFCNLGKIGTDETPYYRVSRNYIEPIIKCGGIPFIIPSFISESLSEKILNIINGLIMTGGCGSSDKDDRIEVKEKPRTLRGQNERRYIADRYLIEAALKRNMPLMGMCRGMQMICEIAGGKLNDKFLDEIDTGGVLHRQESSGNFPTHMINLEEGSQLQKILGVKEINVNSFHNQFCVEPGKNFKASAWAKNGITETIESTVLNFALGLQFHPEMMFNDYPIFIKIFKAFVDKCREYKNSKSHNKK